MIVQILVVINLNINELIQIIEDLPDWRTHPQYTVRELAMGDIFIFLFKRGSRNNADNTNRKGNFSKNLTNVFSCRIPDTYISHLVMEYFSTDILKKIKQSIV